MELEKFQNFNRQVAVKTTIEEVSLGEFVQENEQTGNYLLTRDGRKLSRVNVAATVLHKEAQGSITNILIDDGSEKIVLRSFEDNSTIRELTIGDVVLVIGRARIYNKEKYISPEIVKKIDPLWLKVRSLELKSCGRDDVKSSSSEKFYQGSPDDSGNVEDNEIKEEEIENDFLLPVEKLKRLISELDSGSGALIEEVIEKSPLDKTEEIIQKMLENGDIFQNSPGKIKVL